MSHEIFPVVFETFEVSYYYLVFCQERNIMLSKKLLIFLITIETNLNLILIHSTIIYTVLWIFLL